MHEEKEKFRDILNGHTFSQIVVLRKTQLDVLA